MNPEHGKGDSLTIIKLHTTMSHAKEEYFEILTGLFEKYFAVQATETTAENLQRLAHDEAELKIKILSITYEPYHEVEKIHDMIKNA